MKLRSSIGRTDGFTLIETMIAAALLVLVFVSSIGAMTIGFRLLEDARFNTLSSQVLQSEIENLRLKNWSDVSTLPASESITIESALDAASFNRFTCVRKITSVRADTKRIVVALSWSSMNGKVNTRSYVTYMTKDGLNDYYYTKS